MSVSIYHNSRCSKSRQALAILEAKNIKVNIVEYLKEGLTESEVLELAEKLSLNVNEFIRKKEAEFKDFDIDWSDNKKAAKALSDCPKLLERPIVIKDNKAVVARPPEDLEKLF